MTELAVAGLFTACYLLWPVPIVGFEIVKFVWLLITIVGLTAISIYDLRWMIIPNTIIYPLIVLAVGVVGYEAIFLDGGPELVRSAVLGLLGCGGILYGIFQVSKGKWIGGGDVKLGFLLGIMALSFMRGLLVILLSSFVGLVAIAPMLFAHKFSLKAKIPFGPFLIIAGLIVYFFGQQLLDWYMNVLVV